MTRDKNLVCQCFEVRKKDIVQLIRKNHIRKLVDIQTITRAATGCGRCKPLITAILKSEEHIRKKIGDQLLLDLFTDLKPRK